MANAGASETPHPGSIPVRSIFSTSKVGVKFYLPIGSGEKIFMNRLPLEKRAKIIQLLCEGTSMRAITRIVNVSLNTVTKLLVETGKACLAFHDQKIRGIVAKQVQVDEVWGFVYAKQRNAYKIIKEAGDSWVWIAMDAETKLVLSWHVGARDMVSAKLIMKDLAGRLKKEAQLSTDGYQAYPEAVRVFFDDVSYGQVEKVYGRPTRANGTKDNRLQYIRSDKKVISGSPDPKKISTSYIERQNLTMRMHMRRFTRKTNGFSKKPENHRCAIALHFVYYNFVRRHQTLRITPAMEAGITKRFMSFEDVANLAENSN